MTPEDEAAFLAFARERTTPLFRAALLLTGGDWHLAEDLVQETLTRLYRFWGRVVPADNPAGYAHTVLVRTFLSHRRRRSSGETPVSLVPDRPGGGIDPVVNVILLRALGELSPADRAVLVLRFYADRSVDQVAHDLDRSPGAIRTHTHRALGRLRELLGTDLTDLSFR